MLNVKRFLLPAAIAVAGMSTLFRPAQVQAVHTQYWRFHTEAAYAAGHFHGTQVNNYGELRLSRAVHPLFAHASFKFVNAMVTGADGSLYVGTSPHGRIYRIRHGKRGVYYTPPKGFGTVLSLALMPHAGLLAALTGTHARLVLLTSKGGKVSARTLFENKAVDYIWAILPMADGNILLATGPHGELWRVGLNGKSKLLLKTGVHNITSMIAAPHGRVIIGTDQTGMVLRVNPQTGRSFVLLSAGHAEISSLAVDRDGDIFAGTASPNLAKQDGGVFTPQARSTGRPASIGTGTPSMKLPAKGHLNAVKKPAKVLIRLLKGRVAISPMPAPAEPNQPASNVVYEISATGKTRILLHVPDMVLAMLYQHHTLILGLGNHGRLLFYNPFTQTESLMDRVKQADINALAAGMKGRIFMGTANQGQVYRLAAGTLSQGTYESSVQDGKLTSTWGAAHVTAVLPPGSAISIQTRSGNVQDVAKHAAFWSRWSAPIPAGTYRRISSPPARFLQFRITLKSNAAGKTPVVERVSLAHQQINVPPQITSITAAALPSSPHKFRIAWKAADANGDSLTFNLAYREQGIPVWVKIAHHVTQSYYVWNTRDIPDGRYRVKLIASDKSDNTPQTAGRAARETRYFLVENTPPTLSRLKTRILADGRVEITGIAADTLSPITSVSFQVDSATDWREATASDTMFDSPLEAFTARTGKLSAGAHRISLRATDARGNHVYRSILVQIH